MHNELQIRNVKRADLLEELVSQGYTPFPKSAKAKKGCVFAISHDTILLNYLCYLFIIILFLFIYLFIFFFIFTEAAAEAASDDEEDSEDKKGTHSLVKRFRLLLYLACIFYYACLKWLVNPPLTTIIFFQCRCGTSQWKRFCI